MSARRTWDELVVRARVPHFMFRRDYMEYHADRIRDHSLVVRRDARVHALLPASRDGTEVISHGGLTFGGFVTDRRMTSGRMLEVVERTAEHLRDEGITRMVYKPAPHIYQSVPADEDVYALSRCGAQLVRRRVTSAIALDDPPRLAKGRRHALARARRREISVRPSSDLRGYGRLLADALARRDAQPVHSADELALLASKHPANIRLFVAMRIPTLRTRGPRRREARSAWSWSIRTTATASSPSTTRGPSVGLRNLRAALVGVRHPRLP